MVNKIAKPDVYSLKQTNELFAALTKVFEPLESRDMHNVHVCDLNLNSH